MGNFFVDLTIDGKNSEDVSSRNHFLGNIAWLNSTEILITFIRPVVGPSRLLMVTKKSWVSTQSYLEWQMGHPEVSRTPLKKWKENKFNFTTKLKIPRQIED